MRIQNEVEDALDALHSTLKDNRSVADRYHDRLVEALTLICGPDATYNTQLKGIEIGKSLLPEIEKEASQ